MLLKFIRLISNSLALTCTLSATKKEETQQNEWMAEDW